MSTPRESLEQLHTLAAAGNIEALVKLGDHYLNMESQHDSENVNMDTDDDDAKSTKEKPLAKYAKQDQGKIKAIPYYYRAALLEHANVMKQWEQAQASQSQFNTKTFSDGLKILESSETDPIIKQAIIKILTASSEKGDRHAQYLLGMHLIGKALYNKEFFDEEIGYEWLRKSASAGYPYARLKLALDHIRLDKIGFARAYNISLPELLPQNLCEHTRYTVWLHYFASAGCVEAQYRWANMLWQSYMYNTIIPVHPSFTPAGYSSTYFSHFVNRNQGYLLNFINQNNMQSTHIDWLKRGIENKDFESGMALGHCYIYGDGVEKNKTLGKSILVKKLMEKFEKEKTNKDDLLYDILLFDLPELLPYLSEKGFTFEATFEDCGLLAVALSANKYYLARSLVEHKVEVNFPKKLKLDTPLHSLVQTVCGYNNNLIAISPENALKYFKCILGLIPLFAQKGSQMEISKYGNPSTVSLVQNIRTSLYEFAQPQQAILARNIQKLYLVLHVVTPMFEPGVMQVIANEVDLKYIASKGNVLETHRLKDRNEIDRLLNEVLRACMEELFIHHEARLDEAVQILNAANINQDQKAIKELMFSVLYHHLRFCYLHKRQEEVFWKPYVDYLLSQDNKIFAHLMPIHYIILDFLENDKATPKGFSDDIEVDIDSVFHPANIKRTKSNLQFQRLKCVYQHLKARLDADLMLELPALEKESPLESNKRKLNELSKPSEVKELSTAPTDHLMEVPIEILQALQAFEDLNEDVRMTTEEEQTQQQDEEHGNAQQEQTQEDDAEEQAKSLEEPKAKRRKLHV